MSEQRLRQYEERDRIGEDKPNMADAHNSQRKWKVWNYSIGNTS